MEYYKTNMNVNVISQIHVQYISYMSYDCISYVHDYNRRDGDKSVRNLI